MTCESTESSGTEDTAGGRRGGDLSCADDARGFPGGTSRVGQPMYDPLWFRVSVPRSESILDRVHFIDHPVAEFGNGYIAPPFGKKIKMKSKRTRVSPKIAYIIHTFNSMEGDQPIRRNINQGSREMNL